MHVHCTHCGQRIPAEDLNIETTIARCRQCDAVFSFATALEREGDERRPVTSKQLDAVPQPKGIQVDDLGGRLEISRRWFTPAMFFLLFFCIFWDGFLVFWYSKAFGDAHAPLVMVLFPLIHVAVGLGLTYLVICSFVNTTKVLVESGRLSVRHGPLPWPGNVELDTYNLDQLYCRQHIRHSRNGVSESYQVHAITKDQRKIKLISGLSDPEQALFLEQKIEQHLGIEDRAVAGEYRG